MKAIVIDASVQAHLRLGDIPDPQPTRAQAVVRVRAISLNRGEVRAAQMVDGGYIPGWDLAGVVEQAAGDGSGPQAGARVVGFMALRGAWAERVAVPTNALAELPERVSFAQAATLPVAGLTALYCLEMGHGLVGKRVLITGASGGVGNFAVQLAHLGGARVIAQVRRAEHVAEVSAAGADEVVVSEDGSALSSFGPYDLIVDGVGGQLLGTVIGMLGKDATCVAYGSTSGSQVTFDLPRFFRTGGARLYGFILFHEVLSKPAVQGLRRLAELVAAGSLKPLIGAEANWDQIGAVAQRLLERDFTGKAVLYT